MTQEYYGTKKILAWEETKQIEKDGMVKGEPGYGVKYENGYTSWSPKEAFEKAYQPLNALSFGHAIEAMKSGEKVTRAGWNGKGMFLFLVPGSQFKVNRAPLLGIYPEGEEVDYCPHIDMRKVDGKIEPWLASQTDMLANDWQVVDVLPEAN